MIILTLSSILQTIVLECPTALVWNFVSESKVHSSLSGLLLFHVYLASIVVLVHFASIAYGSLFEPKFTGCSIVRPCILMSSDEINS